MRWWGLGLLGMHLGCVDGAWEAQVALIDKPQVVAVIAEPAELRPGEQVQLTAVVAEPVGQGLDVADVGPWTFCTTARSVGSAASVAEACRTEFGVPLAERALQVQATVPEDACSLFGPEPPGGDLRPQDPDSTGGYYQPVRLSAFGSLWLYFVRVRCALADAPTAIAKAYAQRYAANRNPALTALQVGEVTLAPEELVGEVTIEVAGEQTLALHAVLAADAAETYVWFDSEQRTLVERQESLEVRWFVNGGELTVNGQGAQIGEARWQLPAEGQLQLWVVLADDRGGMMAGSLQVRLTPGA